MLAVADEGVPRDDRKESPQSKRKGVYKGKRFPLYRGMLSPSVVFVFFLLFQISLLLTLQAVCLFLLSFLLRKSKLNAFRGPPLFAW